MDKGGAFQNKLGVWVQMLPPADQLGKAVYLDKVLDALRTARVKRNHLQRNCIYFVHFVLPPSIVQNLPLYFTTRVKIWMLEFQQIEKSDKKGFLSALRKPFRRQDSAE